MGFSSAFGAHWANFMHKQSKHLHVAPVATKSAQNDPQESLFMHMLTLGYMENAAK